MSSLYEVAALNVRRKLKTVIVDFAWEARTIHWWLVFRMSYTYIYRLIWDMLLLRRPNAAWFMNYCWESEWKLHTKRSISLSLVYNVCVWFMYIVKAPSNWKLNGRSFTCDNVYLFAYRVLCLFGTYSSLFRSDSL